VFSIYIGKFVVVYFDDIVTYNKSEEEQSEHLSQIIAILDKEKLYGNLKNVPSLLMRWFAYGTVWHPME